MSKSNIIFLTRPLAEHDLPLHSWPNQSKCEFFVLCKSLISRVLFKIMALIVEFMNSAYIMISRFKSLQGMYVLRDFDGNKRINNALDDALIAQLKYEKHTDLAL